MSENKVVVNAQLSEKTRLTLGLVITLCGVACSIWASVSVSLARTDAAIATQNKRLDYNTEKRDSLADKVNAIDIRTARMEGMLEELRSRRR